MIRALRLFFCALPWLAFAATAEEVSHKVLTFDELKGWEGDNHAKALSTFQNTCADMDDPDWRALCALAQQEPDAKSFFELFFRPVEIDNGSRPSARYRYPLYREPNVSKVSNPWLTRREIETGDYMQGKGLEIAWVDDPVELFFLQIQGSGRIRLHNGKMIRVGYGGSSCHCAGE